jgi:hypothetical protein
MRSRSLWFIALASTALLAATGRANETDELRRQVEAQNELIRKQSEALERQAREVRAVNDRLRVLEDERAVARTAAPAAVSAGPPDGPAASAEREPHVPGSGFRTAESEWGSLNARLYASARYLNQNGVDDSFTDSFGTTSPIDARHEAQLLKATLYSFGWVLDPKFTYLLYVWSSNSSQGLGAQVVVAGNLKYQFGESLTLGFGINALPSTRTTSGTFPFWLGVDQRLIADEFFRASYTSGIFASGRIAPGWHYEIMLGNNLSQLGVDSGQFDPKFNTVSGTLAFTPGDDYGQGFGDFAHHERLATRLAVHFTRSDENAQGQPDTEAFENSQIRLSDGNVIFEPGLFAPGAQVRDATYTMFALDGGLKYRGLALEGEYFYRRITELRGPGIAALDLGDLEDHGFQLQGSAMLIEETLQIYLSGSLVFGEYGDPWDARLGLNWFPFQSQSLRWNNEVIYVERSPVGAFSLPYNVGVTGPIFLSTLEMFF